MKWKTIFLYSLALFVIGATFVVGPVLLRSSISQTINRSFLTDAPTADLSPSENIVEKLLCIDDPESTSVQLNTDVNIEQLIPVLQKAFKMLSESGAIPQIVYDCLDAAVSEGYDAELLCIIQPNQHLMFEVYSIYFWNFGLHIVLDLSSEKILLMSYEPVDDGLLALELDETQVAGELQGWADYLNLKPGTVRSTDFILDEITHPEERRDPVMLKELTLTDGAGNSVSFCQTYAYWENRKCYMWRPIY